MAEHFDNHDILSQNTTQDNVIKMLFTHKQIVAIMLRECLPEFNGVPLNFITEKCLDGLEDADYLIGDKTHGNAGTDMDWMADAVDLALKRRDVEHLLFRRDDAARIERFRDFVASLPDA